MKRQLVAMPCVVIFAMLVWAATASSELPRVVHASVDRVVDGDSLLATSASGTTLRIRLLGIDAPEIAHRLKPGQPFGPESRRYLARLVLNRTVRLELFGPDLYRRMLAVVWTGDTNVNVEMVRVGLAELYRGSRCQAYCRTLEDAEAWAQRERAGIWGQGQHESPTAYRRRTRS